MPKDPKRWQEVIIDSPFAKLTKQDVFDYYNDPKTRSRIQDALRSTGSGETIIRQNFDPGRVVLRRKDRAGSLIDLTKAEAYATWADQRMSEVHPVFGPKTNVLLADIDPGEKVPWKKTKAIAEAIAKTMASDQGMKEVNVQFSGDRGFYVKGILKQKMDIDSARRRVNELVGGLVQRPDVTMRKPGPEEIRIDTTPLKNRGSVKAPYSLSGKTGLIAAPVDLKDLPRVRREDFRIGKVKMAAQKEFAPGIPASRKIDKIPAIKEKAWQLAVQTHEAERAGKHWDLRLVDPKTHKAHSFAVPKARFPETGDKMLLAIQQPTHTEDYALNFQGKIPSGTYGAGTVTTAVKEPIHVIRANANRIHFEREGGDEFVMFRTDGNKWGLKKKAGVGDFLRKLVGKAPKKIDPAWERAHQAVLRGGGATATKAFQKVRGQARSLAEARGKVKGVQETAAEFLKTLPQST